MIVRKLLCRCICNNSSDHNDASSYTSEETKKNRSMKLSNGLIDWIRLGNSGVDLAGVSGRPRLITLTELKKHNQKNDAWLAIRGRVYNITHYLPFHPGGAEELMRGAGTDATEIFEKVHPWIKYDSLLIKCYVGTLRIHTPNNEVFYDALDSLPDSDLLIASPALSRRNITTYTTPPRKKTTHVTEDANTRIIDLQELALPGYLGTLKVVRKEESTEDVPPALFYDWEQTLTELTIAVHTGPSSNPGVYSRITERTLLIEVTINGWLRTVKLDPEDGIREPIHTTVCLASGKITVTAQKVEPSQWKYCGDVTIGTATKMSSCKMLEYKVISNEMLTHDTRLLTILPCTGSVVLPVGHHIKIHQTIAGSEYVRSYTPVNDRDQQKDVIQLAIKRYDNGILSPVLTSLTPGDCLKASGPYGTFHLHKLKPIKTIYLLAAGTGITPMIGLVKYALAKSNPTCECIYLLFFNKTEKDIMFQEHLENLANKDSRLCVVHILSNASSAWTGRKGRINAKLLSELIEESDVSFDDSRFAVICGPKEFTFASLNVLRCFGMEGCFIHIFVG